jgi:CHAT domain-containing protein
MSVRTPFAGHRPRRIAAGLVSRVARRTARGHFRSGKDCGIGARVGTALAGSVLILAGLGCGASPRSALPAGVTHLASDVLPERTGEGRLDGIPWSAVRPLLSAPAWTSDQRRAAARARQDLSLTRSPANLHRDALWSLGDGRLDRAVAELSEAEDAAPADAGISSDLAAALLARAAASQDPFSLVLALAASDRAVRHAPALAAARFNRAVALEQLSLRQQAGAEWQACRRVERSTAWTREDSARANAVRAPAQTAGNWPAEKATLAAAAGRQDNASVRAVVGRNRQRSREYVEEEALVAWAAATVEGRAAVARPWLSQARSVAGALAATGGDLAAATVAQIDRLERDPLRSAALLDLAAGLAAYGRGLELAHAGRFSAALGPFSLARRLLERQRSPFAGWARFHLGLCRYERLEYDAAQRLLRPLLVDAAPAAPSALLGRSRVLSALIDTIRGDPEAALASYRQALAQFQALGEEANIAKVGALAAGTLDVLGRPAEAWKFLHPALVEPATFGTPLIRFGTCEVADYLAAEQGELEVALQFQEEVLSSARASGSAYAQASALLRRAALLASLGRASSAAEDLARADALLAAVPDVHTRETLASDIQVVRGEMLVERSPRAAIALLDGAIASYRASQYNYRIRQALVLRARAEQELHLVAAARRDLLAAIQESERLRSTIVPIEERISYFDSLRSMFDAMVAFQVTQGDADDALIYAERARGRALLDWLRTEPGEPRIPRPPASAAASPSSAPLRRRLPADTVILEYWSLGEHLVLWTLQRSGASLQTVAVTADDLDLLVRRFLRAARAGNRSGLADASSHLYRLLIEPVADRLPPRCRIVFVPDGSLHALPFALLRDGRSGRFIIQDHAVSIAPSATLFVAGAASSPELPGLAKKVLYFADPAFDRTAHPELQQLPSARTQEMSALFPGSRVLVGAEATRRAFLAEAGRYEVIHFGGHALVSSQFPLFSQLLFAAEPGDPHAGIIYSRDILGRRFPRTRLAVLASCNTAAGRVSRTEGVESLARPFLAAGVKGVIASLWEVDDDQAALFFQRFYRHLARGEAAIDALQATELESLGQSSPQSTRPFSWAVFELIGSG